MDSNNHFNYGTHSSANSGLKLSSGDSLYTNGSSMSFPQQGKNMNGEMNVNGATTVLGSSLPGSHPPTAPYPHMGNHHQGSGMGYDYLWGAHPQYGSSMGSSSGHGMHQKQPATPGMVQPQSQHHFQGHGQYQLNGGIEGSHQSPAAPNMPLGGSQYWNRNNPGPQQMGYNSHSMYGSYQSQTHPGMAPSQHQQQQQQQPPLQPPPHQSSQQHLHPHRQPSHHHQQHQQPQHYGMMPNGMPYYQHQSQHALLPSPPPPQQQAQQPTQTQTQAPVIPPATQNFTPPRGSPQHPGLGRGGAGSPLPMGVSSAALMSPQESQGSPRGHGRERSPHASSAGISAAVSGHPRDGVKEVDKSYNGTDRTPVGHMPPVSCDSYQQPASQHLDAASSGREPMLTTPLRLSPSTPTSLARDSTPPRMPLATAESTDTRTSDFPKVTSPATHRLSPAPRQEAPPARPAHQSPACSPSAPPSSPLKSTTPFASTPASLEPAAPQPAAPPFCSPTLVPTPSSEVASQTMSHGINRLLMKSATTDDRPTSGPATSMAAAESHRDAASPKQSQMYSPPAAESRLSAASPASVPPVAEHHRPLAAHGSPTARPLPTLPLQTTQASWTAPVSSPPSLVPVPPAASATSGEVPPDPAPPLPPPPSCPPLPGALMMSSSKRQEQGHTEDGNEKREADDQPAQGDSDKRNTWQTTDTDTPRPPDELPVHCFRTPSSLDGNTERIQSDLESCHVQSSVICRSDDSVLVQTPLKRPLHQHKAASATEAKGLNESSQLSELSALTTPSRTDTSSLADEPRSLAEASSDFDSSVTPSQDPSRFDSTTCAKESTCSAFETTGGSISFADDSRDDTIGSARQEETTESEELEGSSLLRGESMLDSSLNDTSQIDEPSVDLSDVSKLHPSFTGPEADWESRGRDTPDSARRTGMTTTAYDPMTPPSFKMRDENFIAFSTPADGPAVHPLQPVTDPVVSADGTPPKSSGKPRKPRTPKAVLKKASASQATQRKPRARTPKVEKPKTEEAEGTKEQPVKGRRRKRPAKAEATPTPDPSGKAEAATEEMDPIMATIEAVLAKAAAMDTSAFKKARRTKKQRGDAQKGDGEKSTADDLENDDDSSTAGETNRRRVATEEQVQFPLQHGWRREIRVRKLENRMKGETWYYTPCGRRMKQFPEIIKYLKKHTDSVVTREHFSFSPRMPIGDFYEERETPEGKTWTMLANEEVPSMIIAITGRRGRPPNPDKEKPRRVRGAAAGQARRPGRPPKPNMIDLLSKVDAKLLKRLEAKEALTEEEKEKLAKIKKKMKKKARMKKREDTKMRKMRAEKRKAKLEEKAAAQEATSEEADPAAPAPAPPATGPAAEPKKPGRRRSAKAQAPPPPQQTDEERIAQGKRVLGARSKAKALAKAQAEAEAAEQAALAAKRAAERRAQAQRRLEERKRQQLIAEELKKPAEDMCLTDHKPLPELSRIPGVVLSGTAFAHCLAVVEFLHAYGKLIGLDVPKDIPSLGTLQEGLLGLGDSQGAVQDLLIKLTEAALHDPGLPSYYQSVKILGDKLAELQLTRSTVSEALRIFLESHGFDTDVCNAMRTKTFHAFPPDTKAAMLGFLVEELNGSNIVTSDIDNTLENMSTYKKNKWITESKLRRLKTVLARRTGRSEEELCFEERRRSARVAEEEHLSLEESGLLQERGGRRGRKEEPKLSDGESPATASIPELERQIDKLTKRQAFFRKKLLQSSHSMRATLLGQDRFRRRYLVLPHLGGVLVEGPEELLASGDVLIAEVPVTFLKREPKVEETPVAVSPPPASPSAAHAPFSPEDDPSTASLMCQPRGRGRPRKIKPEVELHLRTAKIRRRRRSSARSGGEDGPGSPGSGCGGDLTQAALQSWLSHSQEEPPEGQRPEESVKAMAEKQGQWFNLLPKRPCDDSSLAEPQTPASPGSPPELLPQVAVAASVAAPPPPALSPPPQEQLASAAPPADSVVDSSSAQEVPPTLPPAGPASPPPPLPPASNPSPPPPASPLPAAAFVSSPPPDSTSPLPPPASPPTPPTSNPLPTPASAPAPAPTPAPEPAAEAHDTSSPPPPQLLPAPVARAKPARAPARATRRRRRGSRGSSPARRGARAAAAKRRARSAGALFQELEQQYFTQLVVKPIPASMVRGWWWIKDPEELYCTLQALHPRGVREKVLHKHLAKHMETLVEMCTKPIDDPMFELKAEEKDALLEELQKPWQVQERVMEADMSVLKWVEDLEQRVVSADLHLKALPQGAVSEAETSAETPVPEFEPYTIPDSDFTRDDLQYYEHDADPHDDWIVRTKKEWSGLPRIATHPLDLAVLRLANLERNIERRYLKEPLWNPAEVMRLAPLTPTPGEEHPMDVISLESEITSRLRTWRQALDRCRSAPQVCLCLLQLEKAIAWERSVTKVTCQVCKKGDNDECLLLCDGCDRGCHMYCLRPKLTQVPEGDWFCPNCVSQTDCGPLRSTKTRSRVKKKRYEDDSSEDEAAATVRRSGGGGGGGMTTRHKETTPSSSRTSGDAGGGASSSSSKRRRMMTRNQPDLTFCEIILMEMEAHSDAWPFLEPVNPRLVPGYRRIIKNPMDFLTMRERLLQGGYCSCEEFAADAQLVFNNCELFNEDTSEVGMAGHAMRRFFESRWAEFYSDKDK